jgi:hypothetical protein
MVHQALPEWQYSKLSQTSKCGIRRQKRSDGEGRPSFYWLLLFHYLQTVITNKNLINNFLSPFSLPVRVLSHSNKKAENTAKFERLAVRR